MELFIFLTILLTNLKLFIFELWVSLKLQSKIQIIIISKR